MQFLNRYFFFQCHQKILRLVLIRRVQNQSISNGSKITRGQTFQTT